MCGSHLQATRTELDIHIVILDHRDLTSYQRYDHPFAFQVLILRVIGIDTHRGITHDGLRTSRSDNRITLLAHDLITQVIELAVLLLVDHLLVREGRQRLGIPIDHTYTPIDQAFVIEIDKDLDHAL